MSSVAPCWPFSLNPYHTFCGHKCAICRSISQNPPEQDEKVFSRKDFKDLIRLSSGRDPNNHKQLLMLHLIHRQMSNILMQKMEILSRKSSCLLPSWAQYSLCKCGRWDSFSWNHQSSALWRTSCHIAKHKISLKIMATFYSLFGSLTARGFQLN